MSLYEYANACVHLCEYNILASQISDFTVDCTHEMFKKCLFSNDMAFVGYDIVFICLG
jgi:hypothetical protein